MSKNNKFNYRRPEKGRNRPNRPKPHITVRSVRRTPPDLTKLGRAIIAAALAEAAAEKAAAVESHTDDSNLPSTSAATTEAVAAPTERQEVVDDE
ncbi:hypothetical protein OG225_16755 [Nocardia sp. NBC_01377]|uniref:hypothetical protein n=1 Tax=Nocardia sp. NBC_01377 TaxID=2903595 RepID=UPI00324C536F